MPPVRAIMFSKWTFSSLLIFGGRTLASASRSLELSRALRAPPVLLTRFYGFLALPKI